MGFLSCNVFVWWVYGCEVVDTAATQRDSLKRLAFVAAFAMSNYSSTIGRIAKPFNPMLVSFGWLLVMIRWWLMAVWL